MEKGVAQNKNHMDMLHGKLLGKILIFALPLAASSVLQQLFNSVDVAVVGKFVGSRALAAVSCNGPVISLLINLFVGLSVGANVVIANYIGQRNHSGIQKAIRTIGIIAPASGLFLMVIGLSLAPKILTLMDTPQEVLDQASLYLRIYFSGMPFIMVFNFGAAVLRSMGDTKRPLYCLIVSGIINTMLNLVLILVFHMGVEGVAIATVAANIFNATMIVIILKREKAPFTLELKRLGVSKTELKKMLMIGVPMGLQGMVFSISNLFIQTAVNGFGHAAIAGSGVALNFEFYCYFVISSFTQAAVTFTGQNYGARQTDRCNRVFRLCMMLSVVSCFVLNMIFVWQAGFFVNLFSSDPEVAKYAYLRMEWVLIWQFVSCSYEVAGSAMRGLGWSLTPMLLTVFGTCILRLLWIYLIYPLSPGFRNLMIIYPVTWAITGLAVLTAYFIVRKKAYSIYDTPRPAVD